MPHPIATPTTDVLAALQGRRRRHECPIRRLASFGPAPQRGDGAIYFSAERNVELDAQESTMAKEQKRGNREAKKPKQPKKPEAAPMALSKGLTPSNGNPKKKG